MEDTVFLTQEEHKLVLEERISDQKRMEARKKRAKERATETGKGEGKGEET